MKKFKILLAILFGFTILYLLQLFFFPDGKILTKTNRYFVRNEKNIPVNCEIFQGTDGMIVILFKDQNTYNRIHINFKHELVGFPENGFTNYRIKGNKLLLFEDSFFHNNGSLYKPFMKAIDQVNFEFYNNKMTIDCISFLTTYGTSLTIAHK